MQGKSVAELLMNIPRWANAVNNPRKTTLVTKLTYDIKIHLHLEHSF
jgi:hypothetical protein